MKSSEELKKIVKDKYGEIALAPKKGCCGGNDEPEFTVFCEDYRNLPGYVEDADLNLGCGLPTRHAGILPGHAVLDLGSGAGNDCFVARSIVGDKGKVTGLDFTDEMLEKARRNNEKMGYKNVEFIKGDIEDMPISDGSFDVVISNCVLNLVPDKEKAFSEIHRVLKDGGHFCVSDIVLKGYLPEPIRDAATLYAGCVSGALQKNEYLEIIEKTGFRNIEVKQQLQNQLPDELLLPYITQEEIKSFRANGTGIYSITVVAYK